MIEPDVTAVLGRRLLAFMIDGGLVAAAAAGAAYQQSTAFGVVGRDASDSALVDPADFEEMNTLLDFEVFGRSEIFGIAVVRAQEIGDSVRVFGADSYLFGALAALVMALVGFWLIPTAMQRTIGMVPVNLMILDRDGGRASRAAHVKRTVFGTIDLLPLLVPGLLGMIAAATTPLHQRIGDRIAGTVVVDRTTAAFKTRDERGRPISLDLGPVVPLDEAVGSTEPTNIATDDHVQVVPDRAAAPRPQPANGLTIADAPAPVPTRDDTAIVEQPLVEAVGTARGSDLPGPVVVDDHGATTLETTDLLPPPPIHRRQPATETATPPVQIESNDLAGGGHEPPGPPLDTGAATAAAAEATNLQPNPQPWQPPRSEPAPVWQPTPLDPAPTESPDPHDGRTLDDVELSGIGELLTADAPDPDDSLANQRGSDEPAAQASAEASRAPVWSDKWRAWMYWDAAQKCWLRHDTENNRWVPVD
jgi:uncharacterized RDD family membrane protein YckC